MTVGEYINERKLPRAEVSIQREQNFLIVRVFTEKVMVQRIYMNLILSEFFPDYFERVIERVDELFSSKEAFSIVLMSFREYANQYRK